MKVSELIEVLKQQPQEAEVVTEGCCGEPCWRKVSGVVEAHFDGEKTIVLGDRKPAS